jgi:hypothetical protein
VNVDHYIGLATSLLLSVIYLARVLLLGLPLVDLEEMLWEDVEDDLTLREMQWVVWWSPSSRERLATGWQGHLREERLARLRGE